MVPRGDVVEFKAGSVIIAIKTSPNTPSVESSIIELKAEKRQAGT